MITTQVQVTVHQFSRLFTELREAFPNAEIIELRAGCIGLRFEPGVWIEVLPDGDGEYRACVRDSDGVGFEVGGSWASPSAGLPVCAVTSANGVHAVRAQVNELARLWRARVAAQQDELNSYLFAAGLLDTAR